MEYLESKPLNDSPEFIQSATNSPIKENIEGGNTYDNILKLVEVRDYTINVPEIAIGFDGTASYSKEDLLTHSVGQVPFVDIEWRDPSQVGSGETNIVSLTADYNNRFIRLQFSQDVARFGMFPDLTPIPATDYNIKIYIYKLNTKRRLDSYVK